VDEELQSLLTRIRTEGVERAESQAGEIVSAAEAKARSIVSAAEEQATEINAAAERDSRAFTERSRKALDQLARDFLISVQKSLEALFNASVQQAAGEALTPETMAQMMIKLADSYGANGLRESRIELLVSPEDQEEFIKLVMGSYREQLGHGVEIRPQGSIQKGFKVAFPEGKLYHDFTQEAISASLSQLLKPPLREIVQRASEAEGK
jgi:V/A-type H+-transporting ATPase subunit E